MTKDSAAWLIVRTIGLLLLLSPIAQPCAAASLDAVVSLSFKTKERSSNDCTYTLSNRSTRAIYYAHPLVQFASTPKAGERVSPPPIDTLVWHHVRVRPNDSDSFVLACPKAGEYAAVFVSLDEESSTFTLVWSRHKNE